MAAPETKKRVERDIALFKRIDGAGLPLTFVDNRVIVGFNPERLEGAVAMATAGPRPELPVAWMWVVLAICFGGAAAVSLRSAGRSPPEAESS